MGVKGERSVLVNTGAADRRDLVRGNLLAEGQSGRQLQLRPDPSRRPTSVSGGHRDNVCLARLFLARSLGCFCMTPVSEAVKRVQVFIDVFALDEGPNSKFAADLSAILADHARLTEQVRAQMLAAAPALSASPAPALGDQVERVAAVIEREMCDADGPVKAIDIARAVIAAMQPVGWRDMESAPKDGTRIIGYEPGRDRVAIMWWELDEPE
jgi:hypothetical protein